MEPIKPNGVIGSDRPRIDGVAKVTGQARYGADERAEHAAFAYLATAGIARGRIRAIDEQAARAVPGVLDILTHVNVGKAVRGGQWMMKGGYMADPAAPLGSDRVRFAGQIVAVALAETFEAARAAADRLRFDYEAETPAATFHCPGTKEVKPNAYGEAELAVGDFDQGLRRGTRQDRRPLRDAPRSTTIRWSFSRPPARGPGTI